MPKKTKKLAKKISSQIIEKKPEVQTEKLKKTKIKMIGIGGGAGAIVSEIALRVGKATFVAANTDLKALKLTSRKLTRFPFGQNLTKGLGTGMNAQLGREAALGEKDKIKKLLEGQDLCILVASLGGGTGSGAVPIFAKIAKKLGCLSYGIFTLPFKFEGEKKMEIAKNSLKKVKNYLNAFSIIPNERVFQIINKETPLKQALSTINKFLAESLGGLIETIYEPGLINIDFADFRTIMEGRGRLTYLNTIELKRKGNQVQNLITQVLNSPFYPYTIRGAKGVLFNIAGEKDLSLSEVDQISRTIAELANPEAKIIFGIAQGQRYSDIIKTTLLATGCGMKFFSSKSKTKKIKKTKKKNIKKPLPIKEKAVVLPKIKKKPKKRKKKIKVKIKKKEKLFKKPLRLKPLSLGKKSKPKKIKIKVIKKPETKESSPAEAEMEKKQTSAFNIGEDTVRKSALQIKKESEELEREMLEKEKFWETPAFLRKKIIKGQ